ncbi:MAG: hypothetical protein JJ958_09750 [Balneola sp.]|nr:hypothetical protein [Balneola sp.]
MKATVTYIFCFSMLLISCNVINFGSGDLKTDLELEETEITNVQDIEATFSVRNKTDETKEYSFSSGCQVSFLITENSTKIIKAEEKLICTMALTSFKLEKDESKTFELPTYFDIDLKPGTYSIKAYLIGYEDEVFATKSFSVN